jgi:hypothetical protein
MVLEQSVVHPKVKIWRPIGQPNLNYKPNITISKSPKPYRQLWGKNELMLKGNRIAGTPRQTRHYALTRFVIGECFFVYMPEWSGQYEIVQNESTAPTWIFVSTPAMSYVTRTMMSIKWDERMHLKRVGANIRVHKMVCFIARRGLFPATKRDLLDMTSLIET